MQALTIQEAQELYRNIGKVDFNSKEVKEAIAKGKYGDKAAPSHLALLSKIAKKSTEQEFLDFALKNETPAIKLTNEEMEIIKGGATPGLVIIGYGVYKLTGAILSWF